jgi:tetratricopeptide (TPR) repeat protein
MPFGTKVDTAGMSIQFDRIYREIVEPAITAAGMLPLRPDEEMAGGVIQKPSFERLMLCDYAIADLTGADASVYYELGIRHAIRPATTVLMQVENCRLPFDVAPLRPVFYKVEPAGGPEDVLRTIGALLRRLRVGSQPEWDSPLFQLVQWMQPASLPREQVDLFHDLAQHAADVRARLSGARQAGVEAVREVERELGDIAEADAAIVIDLFLSYRAVSGYSEMIELVSKMSRLLAETILVQEQLGLALNRVRKRDEAANVLLALIRRRGPSSETYGILGRVYKDQWTDALKSDDTFLARGHLDKAIDAYMRGFEIDPRDAYPGINAATLCALRDPPDPRGKQILPVVRFALRRRMSVGRPDYWDHATLLELAVLDSDLSAANTALDSALAVVREPWQAETTANNIRMIRNARERSGQDQQWILALESALTRGGSPDESRFGLAPFAALL